MNHFHPSSEGWVRFGPNHRCSFSIQQYQKLIIAILVCMGSTVVRGCQSCILRTNIQSTTITGIRRWTYGTPDIGMSFLPKYQTGPNNSLARVFGKETDDSTFRPSMVPGTTSLTWFECKPSTAQQAKAISGPGSPMTQTYQTTSKSK